MNTTHPSVHIYQSCLKTTPCWIFRFLLQDLQQLLCWQDITETFDLACMAVFMYVTFMLRSLICYSTISMMLKILSLSILLRPLSVSLIYCTRTFLVFLEIIPHKLGLIHPILMPANMREWDIILSLSVRVRTCLANPKSLLVKEPITHLENL